MNPKESKKHINKKAIALSAIAVLIVIAASFSVYAAHLVNSKTIYEGVYAGSVDLSGMTKSQAKKAVDNYLKSQKNNELTFKCDDVKFKITPDQISFKGDADKTVNEAYNAGRGGGFFENYKNIMSYKKKGYTVDIKFSYDKDRLILLINENIQGKTVDPSPMNVEVGKDRLYITNPVPGKGINEKKVLKKVQSRLSQFKTGDEIELEIESIKPDIISFDEFAKKYIREAKDAVYTKTENGYIIEPEIVGISFDTKTARQIFEENKNNTGVYEIPAEITAPAVTAKMLEDKYVNKIIASYSTSYAGSSANRCANIALAASKINGYVINPGKRFSYNNVVGPRTAAAGFKSAHVYVGTEVVDGIGGGICQVSSTLYNAAVLADMKIVSRTNHSMPVGYVPLGRDATVSYGSIDFVFENDKPYPVSIKASAQNGRISVSIVGTTDVDYTVEIVTENVKTIPYSTIKTEDPSLPEGQTKTLSNGSNGSVVNSYRVYKKNGKEYSRKFEAKSTYTATPAKVSVGTKKNEPAVNTSQETPPDAGENQSVPPSVNENPIQSEDAENKAEQTAPVNGENSSETELPPVQQSGVQNTDDPLEVN